MSREYCCFRPKKAASWWNTLEDILWPQKKVIDKIKRRAEGFAGAGIDTAVNFGFHTRFDFSNYFSTVHGYLNQVCEELHKYGIRFMDHYSCNLVERPRGDEELKKLHARQRHHVLLHPDEKASAYLQYEGYFFNDICELDVRNGNRGYSPTYQTELFCHNNPHFLDMHSKYLKRLINEVPMDGIMVDDMCDYGGLSTCACKYCRERFIRDYGYKLPSFEDKKFWGDTSGGMISWGNYENPAFRDWIRMKADSAADHVKMIKSTIGDIPLMTCCSATGPVLLNALGLNLERMMQHLDLIMLENCGFHTGSVNWIRMDAEALLQKDIAEKMGSAPAIALSYTIYEKGGYLGWCLSRFWGVGNWSSTLTGRLAEDPADAMEIHDIIGPLNNWEADYSDIDYSNGGDVAEVRLVCSRFCKENGWRDQEGYEHWDKVSGWSRALVEKNIGYRFVRADELSDAALLKLENTPLILEGVACVSEEQFFAVKEYLSQGGDVWLGLPFGSHDEKGFKRQKSFEAELLAAGYNGLVLMDSSSPQKELEKLIGSGKLKPGLRQVAGDIGWAARLRRHSGRIVLHLLNRALEGIPHPYLRDSSGSDVLINIKSNVINNKLEFIIDFTGIGIPWKSAVLMSPEILDEKRSVKIGKISDTQIKVSVDLTGITIYGVVQQ